MQDRLTLTLAVTRFVGLGALAGIAVPPARPAPAQEVESVQTRDLCTGCRIVVDTVARLAARDGPGILGDETLLEMDGRGRLFAIDYVTASGHVLVFDEKGRYEATIGRAGDGPGEFRMPWGFVLDGQTADWKPIANTGRWIEAETQGQYDARVTVIEPGVPRLVVETVIPGKLRGMAQDRTFYVFSEEGPGHPVYTVGRFVLEGATSNGGVSCPG